MVRPGKQKVTRKRNIIIAHYVNNKKLYEVFKVYKQKIAEAELNGKPKPPLPNYVAEAIMLISDKLSRKYNFALYSFIEEMKGDAMLACIKYVDSFNPDKYDNPFAYITQIVYNSFINRINVEQKQQYIKAVIVKNTGIVVDDENFSSDSLNNVIDSFEGKMENRRQKAQERQQNSINDE